MTWIFETDRALQSEILGRAKCAPMFELQGRSAE